MPSQQQGVTIFNKAKTVPGPPSKPVASHLTCRSCLLSWSPPTDDGGKPVIGYRLQLRTHSSCGWTEAKTETIEETQYYLTKLRPGTLCQFRVAAVNKIGCGVGGPESECVEIVGTPEPPSAPRAVTSSRVCCEISWEPPYFDGGTAIIGYHIEYHSDATGWSRLTEGFVIGTRFCTRRLKSGDGYRFRVFAVNKLGESPPGPISDVIETIDVPGVVNPPTVSHIDSKSCVLTWCQPDDDGGSAVRGFHVESNRFDGFGWSRLNHGLVRGNTLNVSNLIISQKYHFRVIAENKKGEGKVGDASREVEAIEPPGSPIKPEIYDVTCQSCKLLWDQPEENGGSKVTSYIVESKLLSKSSWEHRCSVDAQTFCTYMKNLQQGVSVQFRIKAVNKAGIGKPSQQSEIVHPIGADLAVAASMSGVRDEVLEEWGMARVCESFKRGLENLKAVVDSVRPLEMSITYRQIQKVASKVRKFAMIASMCMNDANEKALYLNKELNARIERNVAEQADRVREREAKEREIEKLEQTIAENNKELERLREERRRAKEEYENAVRAQNAAEEKLADAKRERDQVRAVGAGLFAIPIFGWIAGGVMVAVSFTTLEENVNAARNVVGTAQANKDNQKQRVEEKKGAIAEFESKLSDNKSEKDSLSRNISFLNNTISSLRKQLSDQSDISSRLRKLTAFVSTAARRAEVLDDQVKNLYDLTALVKPLQELASHLSMPVAASFAITWDGSGISEFATKLKMVADADASWTNIHVLEHKKDHQVVMATPSAKTAVRTIATINQVSNSICNETDMMEQTKTMLSQHAGWEEFLIPAPMTIAFLGQLMLIGTMKDFPIDKHIPRNGFRYLKHPKSFRASVVQTANATWEVFHTAQTNMDQIRLFSDTVPTHLTGAVKMIMTASNEELGEYLHLPISAMRNIADKCLKRAQETEEGIHNVMELIGELQEACTGTKGHYERQLTKARCNLEVLKEERERIKNEKEILSKQYEQLRSSIQSAEKKFEEAISDIPGGWSALGMQVVDGITSGVNAVVKFMTKPVQTQQRGKQQKPSKQSTSTHSSERAIDENEIKAYGEAIHLHSVISALSQCIDKDAKIDQTLITNVYSYQAKLNSIHDRVVSVKDCSIKKTVKQLCIKGIDFCKQIEKSSRDFSNTALPKSITDGIRGLQADINDIAFEGQELMEACPHKQAPSRESWQITDNVDGGVVKTQLENAKLKAKLSCENLRKAQDSYDRLSSDFGEKSERLAKVLGDVAKINLEKFDFEEILDVLGKGLVELGNLRQSWGKVVHFFQTISNILSCSMDISLNNFIGLSESTRKHALQGYNMSHLKRDMMYDQIISVSQIAYFVSHITETYGEVSKQNIMPAMERISAILKFNPDTQKMAIKHMMESLKSDCEKAQSEIGLLVNKKGREYDQLVRKRVLSIKSQMRQLAATLQESDLPIQNSTELDLKEEIEQLIDEFV